MDLEQELESIKDRNQRVELDKAWENSWIRKIFISLLTYIIALVWLLLISEKDAWLKAFVPVAGFILSTLTLPPLKKWWTTKQK